MIYERVSLRRLTTVALAISFCVIGISGCAAGFEGFEGLDEESQAVQATPELLDGRTYSAPNSYILGRKLAKSTEVMLAFEGSSLTASAGCREAKGPFSVRKGLLRAPDLQLTGKPCSKELSAQEAWLIDLLRGPIHADLASDEAHVLYVGNKKISMEMGALDLNEVDQGRLRSAEWYLDRVERSNSAQSHTTVVPVPGSEGYDKSTPFANSIPTLSMYYKERFEFFTPCGLVQGSFSFDETTIDFKTADESRKSCPHETKEFHVKVAPLFDGSFEYGFDGPDLVLVRDTVNLRFFSG